MNSLLFKSESDLAQLDFADYRATHIKKYLKPKNGDILYVGIINEYIAKAKISICASYYSFEICEKLNCAELRNIEIAVALARPQIAQSILFDCACLGVRKINFYIATKSEASYANASLYTKYEYIDYLIKGAEQACNCHIPEVEIHKSLEEFLKRLPENNSSELRIAPDLYESIGDFADISNASNAKSALLVMGAERGFNHAERNLLRAKNFILALMRERVMRTDTALVYALALLHKI